MRYEETVKGKLITLNVVIEKEGNKYTYFISQNKENPIEIIDMKCKGEFFAPHNNDMRQFFKLKEISKHFFNDEEKLSELENEHKISVTKDIRDILRKVEYNFRNKLREPEYQFKLLSNAIDEIEIMNNISYNDVIEKAGLSTDDDELKKVLKDIIMNHLIKERNDCEQINEGQFRKTGHSINNNDKEIDFHIEHNPLYYEKEGVIKKEILMKFLLEADKLTINPNMLFLPFKIKNNAYLIIIDNLFEGLSITNVQGNFKYFNKQSTIYKIIFRNTILDIKNDKNIFNLYLDYLSINLRKKAVTNSNLLKKIWKNKFKDILKSPYFANEFT